MVYYKQLSPGSMKYFVYNPITKVKKITVKLVRPSNVRIKILDGFET